MAKSDTRTLFFIMTFDFKKNEVCPQHEPRTVKQSGTDLVLNTIFAEFFFQQSGVSQSPSATPLSLRSFRPAKGGGSTLGTLFKSHSATCISNWRINFVKFIKIKHH